MATIELIHVGEKSYPAAVTNHSLSMGEKLGLIKNSQLTDLIETDYHLGVVYLSIIGMNKNLDLSISEFADNYKPSTDELVGNYRNLITACTDIKQNNFAKSFKAVTKNGKTSKDEKRRKPPQLKFECVEDRYVYYCLVYGVPGDIFWYHPIPDVERVFESKQAYDAWESNPVTY